MVNFDCDSPLYKASLLGGSFLWIFNQSEEADVLFNLGNINGVLSSQRSAYSSTNQKL